MLTVLIVPISIVVIFAIYGWWVYQFKEKPVITFCESLNIGSTYTETIAKADSVSGAEVNEFSLGSDLVQLTSDSFILGMICFMKFEDNVLIDHYHQERG